MMWKRMCAVVMAGLLLTGTLTACSDNTGDDEPQPAETTTTTTTASGESSGEWATTLPTEPGYSWDVARYPGGGTVPVQLSVTGPWVLTSGADWLVSTTEIVEPVEVAGLDAFPEYDYVVKTTEGAIEYLYPRQITAEWMLQLGKITVNGDQVTTEPYDNALKLWPVDFAVGDTFVVSDTGSFGIKATVLAQSSATVPAGTIDEAYLVRFDYTPLAEGAMEGAQYYILSPEVGLVALFSVASGDEATGFTALDSAQILVTMPEKR